MSKYKYTSLLSSEYRSVFKSYHSVDRYERQPSLNPTINQKGRSTHSQLKYITNQRNYLTQDSFKTLNYSNSYKPSKYESKTDSWKKANTQSDDYHHHFDKSFQKANIDNERLLTRIRNKYQNNFTSNFQTKNKIDCNTQKKVEQILQDRSLKYQNIDDIDEIIVTDEIPCKRPYIQFHTITHKNNELKMKVSQINKKRNDIKLKMRVHDIDQINRKYNYLQKQTNENHKPNQKNQISLRNIYQHSQILNPLQQLSINKINLKFQKKILQNMTNKKTYDKTTQNHDDQNIQTPHFNHAQTKIKQVDAYLIEKKLQNFVKNTFTDRY